VSISLVFYTGDKIDVLKLTKTLKLSYNEFLEKLTFDLRKLKNILV